MIISRTPFRVSLFGGGTDYPVWFREHGGAVLGTAIDKYCYLSVRRLPPFFAHRTRVAYSQIELVRDVAEIQHPAVRGVLTEMGVTDGLEIHHDGDLPARSGLGSSSAFTVGLLNAIHALQGRMMTPHKLGREAIRIEQEVLNESVGCQDQLWAAHGGLNRIDFHRDGTFSVSPIILKPQRLEELRQSMMLFFTGFSRFSSDFAKEQLSNLKQREQQLHSIRAIVERAYEILVDDRAPVSELGKLLHESWVLKRELASNVSNDKIDEIYQAAREAGAAGGKLMGAGGGGFMIFLVDADKRERVRERLNNLIHVSLNFDREGSKIVLYQPDGL
jgi:D-glycero-alpha-D-manno-heptose-7-phosphate kinase